jgi:hypothetical protein
MLILNKNQSLEIAKKLIQTSGLGESLEIMKQKNFSAGVDPQELLKQVLGLSACNLMRTMKEDFVSIEIMGEDRQDVIDDYVAESLRHQNLVKLKDGADLMDRCQEILAVAESLQSFWDNTEDPKGPGPRYFCVKEVLSRLGDSMNYELRDAFFEFTYLQHKYFIDFFRNFLKTSKT